MPPVTTSLLLGSMGDSGGVSDGGPQVAESALANTDPSADG